MGNRYMFKTNYESEKIWDYSFIFKVLKVLHAYSLSKLIR